MSVVREVVLGLIPPGIILLPGKTVISDGAPVKVVHFGQLLIQELNQGFSVEENLNGAEKNTEYLELEQVSNNTSLVVILSSALLLRHGTELQWSPVKDERLHNYFFFK